MNKLKSRLLLMASLALICCCGYWQMASAQFAGNNGPWQGQVDGDNSLVISWTAPSNGSVSFNTWGSSFDTYLAAYNSDGDLVAYNDDSNGTMLSSIGFRVGAGASYVIVVSPARGSGGYARLNCQFTPDAPATPTPKPATPTPVPGATAKATPPPTIYKIVGRVTNSQTGAGIEGVSISANGLWHYGAYVTTSSDGTYTLDRMSRDDYLVKAYKEGSATTHYSFDPINQTVSFVTGGPTTATANFRAALLPNPPPTATPVPTPYSGPNRPPVVSIQSSWSGYALTPFTDVTVTLSASDPDPGDQVTATWITITKNGSEPQNFVDNEAPYVFHWQPQAPGDYVISSLAYDTHGAMGTGNTNTLHCVVATPTPKPSLQPGTTPSPSGTPHPTTTSTPPAPQHDSKAFLQAYSATSSGSNTAPQSNTFSATAETWVELGITVGAGEQVDAGSKTVYLALTGGSPSAAVHQSISLSNKAGWTKLVNDERVASPEAPTTPNTSSQAVSYFYRFPWDATGKTGTYTVASKDSTYKQEMQVFFVHTSGGLYESGPDSISIEANKGTPTPTPKPSPKPSPSPSPKPSPSPSPKPSPKPSPSPKPTTPPNTLNIQANKDSICAGGVASPAHQTWITATFKSGSGGSVSGRSVTFSLKYPGQSEFSPLTPPRTTNGAGQAKLLLTSSNLTGKIEIKATCDGATGNKSITVSPPESANGGINVTPSRLIADGKQTATVVLGLRFQGSVVPGHSIAWYISEVQDAEGHPVTDQSQWASYGSLSPGESVSNGVGNAATTFTVGTQPGTVTFEAIDLSVDLDSASDAAPSPIKPKEVSPASGKKHPTFKESAQGLGTFTLKNGRKVIVCGRCGGKGHIGKMRVMRNPVTKLYAYLMDPCPVCNVVGYLPLGGWKYNGRPAFPRDTSRIAGRISRANMTRLQEIGDLFGCHNCGTKDPGQRSGWTPDHFYPVKVVDTMTYNGTPLRGNYVYSFFPHCSTCRRNQPGKVTFYTNTFRDSENRWVSGLRGDCDNIQVSAHSSNFQRTYKAHLTTGYIDVTYVPKILLMLQDQN